MRNEDRGTFPTRQSRNPKPNGRPSVRTEEVEQAILAAIRQGKSLVKACEDLNLPSRDSVYAWLAEDEARRAAREVESGEVLFLDRYNTATRLRCDILGEEILTIADRAKTAEEAQIARVKIEARKWYVSKLSPKKYGERASSEVTVQNAVNNITTLSEEKRLQLQERHREALGGECQQSN